MAWKNVIKERMSGKWRRENMRMRRRIIERSRLMDLSKEHLHNTSIKSGLNS